MTLVTTPTVALVGNPNTGKTTLFNALAGLRQRVGNYPGVTVETKKGHFRLGEQTLSLIDLPGTYSLAPRSPDEMVAVSVILGSQGGEARPDVVVTIVDGSNLERNLYLTTQVLELGVPVVVALNMMDVAHAQGIAIDVEKLSERLGVPVIPIQANRGKGLQALKEAVGRAVGGAAPPRHPGFPEAFEQEVQRLADMVGVDTPSYLLRRLLLDVGGYTEQRLVEEHGPELEDGLRAARKRLTDAGCAAPSVEARTRYRWIREVTSGCVVRPSERPVLWTDRLDRVLTHRFWGTLIFLFLMLFVFEAIFAWARPLMDWVDRARGLLADRVGAEMSPGPLRSLITDGVIKGVGGVLMFLPQILILFGFIAVLEDCGYMARAAFLMDKLMARCGLSGKSFIPLLSSMACAVPAILSARVIENKRDRFATILVAPLMSCSARIPVYSLLIAAFLSESQGYPWWVPGLTLFCLYLLGLVLAPLVAWVLKRTLLRGETPAFVMEMPLYKVPAPRQVLQRMTDAGAMFVRRAGSVILASMVVVWALLYFPVQAPDGGSYDVKISELSERRQEIADKLKDAEGQGHEADDAESATALEKQRKELDDAINDLQRDWRSQSLLGRAGKWLEPVIRPLGWDWRVGMAALASFPAREVFVGTMSIIFGQGELDPDDPDARQSLVGAVRDQTWDDDPSRKVFSVPVALSVMVFFALCCQCASTLAVIRRETNSWWWPAFTFAYMTVLAYVGAMVVYQLSSALLLVVA